MADGTTETLENWTVDNFAVILTTRGLIKGQEMLWYIDEVMRKHNPRTVRGCQSSIEEIMRLARKDI